MPLIDAVRKEYQDRGCSVSIALPALAAGGHLQYDRDNSYLKSIRRQYGILNTIHIINQSDALVVIRPDFADSKRIIVPPGVIIGKDEISFQEFDILNISDVTMEENKVTLTFGFEPPLLRDHKKALGSRRK